MTENPAAQPTQPGRSRAPFAALAVLGACALCCVVPPALLAGWALAAAGVGLAAVAGGVAAHLPWLIAAGVVLAGGGLALGVALARQRRRAMRGRLWLDAGGGGVGAGGGAPERNAEGEIVTATMVSTVVR